VFPGMISVGQPSQTEAPLPRPRVMDSH
jgi:hypothetical protein